MSETIKKWRTKSVISNISNDDYKILSDQMFAHVITDSYEISEQSMRYHVEWNGTIGEPMMSAVNDKKDNDIRYLLKSDVFSRF